jgi:hypothetical protein
MHMVKVNNQLSLIWEIKLRIVVGPFLKAELREILPQDSSSAPAQEILPLLEDIPCGLWTHTANSLQCINI